jgi:enamine deaminase RidA (YjgF/YER057c/UK114 family)
VTAERRRARSGSPFEATIGFSRAVRVGERIVVSGTAPIWADGSCPEDAHAQAARCFEIALAALAELGGRPADVVRTRMYITDASVAGLVGDAHRDAVGEAAPAATMVVVAGLLDPRWKVEVELEAVVG